MAVLAPMPRAIETSATLVNSGDRASPRKAYRRSRSNETLDGKRAPEVDLAQGKVITRKCQRLTPRVRAGRTSGSRRDPRDALDRKRFGEVHDVTCSLDGSTSRGKGRDGSLANLKCRRPP